MGIFWVASFKALLSYPYSGRRQCCCGICCDFWLDWVEIDLEMLSVSRRRMAIVFQTNVDISYLYLALRSFRTLTPSSISLALVFVLCC